MRSSVHPPALRLRWCPPLMHRVQILFRFIWPVLKAATVCCGIVHRLCMDVIGTRAASQRQGCEDASTANRFAYCSDWLSECHALWNEGGLKAGTQQWIITGERSRDPPQFVGLMQPSPQNRSSFMRALQHDYSQHEILKSRPDAPPPFSPAEPTVVNKFPLCCIA